MSRSSAWSLPGAHTDVGASLIAQAQAAHHTRLAEARSHTVSTREAHSHAVPSAAHHAARRSKAAQQAWERAAEIERDNLILVQRMRTILARKQVDNVAPIAALPRSLNRHQRAQRMVAVLAENEQLRRRLAAARPLLPTAAALERNHAQLERVIARHCHFPRQDPLLLKHRRSSSSSGGGSGHPSVAVPFAMQPSEEKCQDSVPAALSSMSVPRHHARSLSAAIPARLVPAPPGSRSASSVRPASAQPQSHQHQHPQLQPHQSPSSLVAQEPLLLERRRPASARFRPLRMEQNHAPETEAAQGRTQPAAAATASSRARTSSRALVPRPPRPATAHSAQQHAQAGASTIAPAVAPTTAPAIPALPALFPPAPSSAGSSLPAHSSSSSSSFTPVPLELFSGPLLISGRPTHVLMCECASPWRIEVVVVDVHSDREYRVPLPVQSLRPFFTHVPQVFDPADRRKTKLVQLLKEALVFMPPQELWDGEYPSAGAGDDEGALELCIDLLQPLPPAGAGDGDSGACSTQPTQSQMDEIDERGRATLEIEAEAAAAQHLRTREQEERERVERSAYTPRTRTVIQPLSAAELVARAAAMASLAALSVESDFDDAHAVASGYDLGSSTLSHPDPTPSPPLAAAEAAAAAPQSDEPTFVLPTVSRNRISLTFAPATSPHPTHVDAASDPSLSGHAAPHAPPNEGSAVGVGDERASESSAAELARELNARTMDEPSPHADDIVDSHEADDREADRSRVERARAVPLPPSAHSSGPPSPRTVAVHTAPPSITVDKTDPDGVTHAADLLASADVSASAARAAEDSPSAPLSPSPSSSLIAAGAADDGADDGDALFDDGTDDGDDFLSQIDDLDAAAPILVVASRPSSARPSSLSRAASFSAGSRPHTAGRERIGSDGRRGESPRSGQGHSRQQTGSAMFAGGGGAGFIIEEHHSDSDAESGSDTLEELEHIEFETPHA